MPNRSYRLWFIIAAISLSVASAHAQQDGAWIYDIFVQKCRESGGSPGSTREQYLRGEKFVCRDSSSGRSTGRPPANCSTEAKINVDWVFNDGGARSTYTRQRASGLSPFDAVVAAQGHNPNVQALLRQCQAWVDSYLLSRADLPSPGAPGDPTLSRRKLGPGDCRCISVLPTGTTNSNGMAGYRVVNTCDPLKAAVRFVGDIARLSPGYGLSSWAQAGLVGGGKEATVYAPPDWTLVSIKAVTLTSTANSHTCNF
ncbi:MAG: hypothetical protein ABL907_07440 [Hyphomicrobium sp.]